MSLTRILTRFYNDRRGYIEKVRCRAADYFCAFIIACSLCCVVWHREFVWTYRRSALLAKDVPLSKIHVCCMMRCAENGAAAADDVFNDTMFVMEFA